MIKKLITFAALCALFNSQYQFQPFRIAIPKREECYQIPNLGNPIKLLKILFDTVSDAIGGYGDNLTLIYQD